MSPPLVRHPSTLNSAFRYGSAALLTALTVSIQFLIIQKTGIANVGLFYPMAFLVAWYFGFGPSVLSIFSGPFFGLYFVYPPQFSWYAREPSDYFRLAVFILTSTIVARIIDRGKRAELRLKDSLIKYRSASRATRDAIWDWDLITNQIEWNEALETEFGYALPSLVSTSDWWKSKIHPDDRERIVGEIRNVIDSGKDHWFGEYRFLKADGSYATIFDRGFVVRDRREKAIRMIGTAQDTTARTQALRDLQALQKRFDQVARAAHLGIWYTDLPLRKGANYWNDEMKRHAWIDSDSSLENFDFYSFIHPDDQERVRRGVMHSIETGEALDTEYRSVRPGHPDQMKWIHTYGWIDRDAHGVPCHFDGFALDVTQEKRFQEELKKSRDAQAQAAELLRIIADQIPAFVGYINAEGRYQFVNRMYEEWLGLKPEEILGKTRAEFGPKDSESITLEHQKKALSGTPTRYEISFLKKTGETHYLEVHYIPHFDRKSDQVLGAVIVGLDVTKNIVALQAAEKLADDLQAAVRARDTFLSIASHELRTPITGMKLQTQIMRREIDRKDLAAYPPERVAELVERTDRGLDRMNRLVEDMLDISRIQSGRLLLRPESVDLGGIIRESIERYSASLAQARISVSLDITEGLIAQVDRFRMEQVFTNLITNSIRYASGGPLFVRLVRRNEEAEITFQDSGPGIAPEDRERVFQRFERLSSSKQPGGLGLGLYIVREIVRGHGGSIHVEGTEGKGARFVIHVPLSTASLQ